VLKYVPVAIVNTVVNFLVLQKAEDFLNSMSNCQLPKMASLVKFTLSSFSSFLQLTSTDLLNDPYINKQHRFH
jgi:hypothetical protein